MVDTDPTVNKRLSTYSTYGSDEPTDLPETGLIIRSTKRARPSRLKARYLRWLGLTVTPSVCLPPTALDRLCRLWWRREITQFMNGRHRAITCSAMSLPQNVTVDYGEVAEVVFCNDPYGSLRVEKEVGYW